MLLTAFLPHSSLPVSRESWKIRLFRSNHNSQQIAAKLRSRSHFLVALRVLLVLDQRHARSPGLWRTSSSSSGSPCKVQRQTSRANWQSKSKCSNRSKSLPQRGQMDGPIQPRLLSTSAVRIRFLAPSQRKIFTLRGTLMFHKCPILRSSPPSKAKKQ